MKRLAFALAITLAFATTVPAVSAERGRLAPADQYFGRLKMSVLGIRNSLKDLSLRADLAAPGDATHIFDKLVLVDDALRDWQRLYPRDTWIPRFTYSLAETYRKLPLEGARERANATLDWLVSSYPHSAYALRRP